MIEEIFFSGCRKQLNPCANTGYKPQVSPQFIRAHLQHGVGASEGRVREFDKEDDGLGHHAKGSRGGKEMVDGGENGSELGGGDLVIAVGVELIEDVLKVDGVRGRGGD
ncbi:uncharacterized protein LOC109832225 [Asparagus officinalis]|uniref:uncharacterized protein LOC109832225 n=1 Tax=Asparagus officinalis TaxID=4686 RepID=UPI00098E2E80|nr:uncharacterized protein LOC109832225 [Asparagus officinalis]